MILQSMMLAVAPAASVAAPAWVVDRAHSHLGFTVTVGGQPVHGEFRRWNAQIAFDPDVPSRSHVVVTVDTASASTGDRSRDEALPTGDWFATRLFPRAVFVTDTISRKGGDAYLAQGRLTLRDKSQPAMLPFTLKLNGSKAVMAGSLSIDRRRFQVGQGQFSETSLVAGTVVVDVSLMAERSAPPARGAPPAAARPGRSGGGL